MLITVAQNCNWAVVGCVNLDNQALNNTGTGIEYEGAWLNIEEINDKNVVTLYCAFRL